MEIRAVGGSVKLDFTEAVITVPTLRIRTAVRGGRIVAGPPRRTFWQWLLRKPGPYHESMTAR